MTKHSRITSGTVLTLLGLLAVSLSGCASSRPSNISAPSGLEPAAFSGPPPITPRWAFKPWVWEDNINTQAATESLVQGYVQRGIPVGAVIVDSPWETKYNSFVWDTRRYPDPQAMIDGFHAQGIGVVLWITSFINTNSPDYALVKSRGYTVNNAQDFSWWKGTGVHLDHTNPAARAWLHGKMDPLLGMGVDGWKLDWSADFVSDPVATYLGSLPRSEFKQHYYADYFDYSRARRSLALTVSRAYSHQGGIGAPIAKSSVSWQGDFSGDFANLAKQKNYIYDSARRGYGAPGVEIGFYGDNLTKTSFLRYTQFAAMTPLMINGGRSTGADKHLPWNWDAQTVDIYRYYATLHSELASYLFSYGVEAHLTGKSIFRAVDKAASHHKLGEEVFVSILTSDATSKTVSFPAGATWIDYWNEKTVYPGGSSAVYPVPLARFPIFIKAGAILPLSVRNAVTGHGDSSYANRTTLLIYPAGVSSFTFHRPTGDGIGYSDVQVSVDEAAGSVRVTGTVVRSYILRVKSFSPPSSVQGADSWSYDGVSQYLTIRKRGDAFTIAINGLKGYG